MNALRGGIGVPKTARTLWDHICVPVIMAIVLTAMATPAMVAACY